MKFSKELKVGIFMVTAIVLLYFGFNFLKGTDFFSSDKKYFAVFQNVNKLTESNQIFLNGYAVGRVSDIRIDQKNDRVIVELAIDSEIILTKNSEAVLGGELLGGSFIQLNVGKGGSQLQPKDTIATAVAKGLQDLIAESAEPLTANITTTMKKMNTVLDSVNLMSGYLNSILQDLRPTPRLMNNTIASVGNNVNTLTGTVRTVGDNLNKTLGTLQPTLDNFKTISDSLKQMELNKTIAQTQLTLAKLNETLSRLNKGDNTMSKLMTEDTLYVNLNKLLLSLDTLANHMNSNPKHFFAPLGKSRKKIERELKKQNP